MKRHLWVFCCLIFFSTIQTQAQDWADKMFTTRAHDYGTVARGTKIEYVFEFQNIYEEDVQVAGVRANCGCVTPFVDVGMAKTWEKGKIRARFNTGAFIGDRKATITVVFNKPARAEVQLQIKGVIRTDVNFTPGVVDFGAVDTDVRGITKRKIQVTRYNNPKWEILDVLSHNTQYFVSLQEIERTSRRTGYELTIEMDENFPVGSIHDELVIVSNDADMERFNLAVQGEVLSPLTTSPSNVDFGEISIGSAVTKKIFVRANDKLTVNDVSSDSELLEFSVRKINQKVSMISVTVTAVEEALIEDQKIKVNTSRGIVTIPVSARLK